MQKNEVGCRYPPFFLLGQAQYGVKNHFLKIMFVQLRQGVGVDGDPVVGRVYTRVRSCGQQA